MCFRKSEGQHILKDNNILDIIVEKSEIKSTDIILEIGPGTGNLTKKLLEVGKKVIAIEKDPRMVVELDKRFRETRFEKKLEVIQSDVLKCDDLPYFDLCVSNLPYKISSPILDKLMHHKLPFRCAVLMFQEEFAERLCAVKGSKNYSCLSVNIQGAADVRIVKKVLRTCFCPPPKVNSCVVRIEPRKSKLNLTDLISKELKVLIQTGFSRKNKTLGSIFRQKRRLSLLEDNYKILQQLSCLEQEEKEEESVVDLMDADDESDEEDDESDFKPRVLFVLKEGNFEHKVSINLALEDFVELLSLFNKVGIHFA